ncbi:MAG: hypothetical protein K0S70_169 [Microbacterium sp.]|jgi:hypothetical protein|nr:hypothetical protein [Microbacterium sp.]
MPTWTVYTRDGVDEIAADHLEVVGGALVFTNHASWLSDVTAAYSPTTWTTVTQDKDD